MNHETSHLQSICCSIQNFLAGIVAALFTLPISLQAQKYPVDSGFEQAVGLGLGSTTDLTYKHFLNSSKAFEATLGGRGTNSSGWFTTGLSFLHHVNANRILEEFEIPEVQHVNYYYGFGGSLYMWSNRTRSLTSSFNRMSWAIHIMFGAECKVEKWPLALSIDWSPRVFLGDGYISGVGLGYGRVGVKYTLANK